jgi:hypothetical protein
MMQRGRQIILGDVGPGLGDSMYDGTIYVGGKVKSLGVDCVPGEWTDATPSSSSASSASTASATRPSCRSSSAASSSTTTTTLEPSERKLVSEEDATWLTRRAHRAHRPRAEPIFTPEVINDIHMKAELGRYRMRGFSMFKKIPHWDDLSSCPGTLRAS